jgi:thiol:disulfide interchange protein
MRAPGGALALSALLAAVLALLPLPSSGAPEQDWNGAIAWQTYADGLQQAKRERKPVCLVIYTTWCPHCTAYARLFHSADVVASARRFVMIRVDKDAEPELSKKYGLDGEYIPRTYFLTRDGEVARIDSGRSDYRYFYDEANPATLLAAMQKALAR